MSFAGRLVGSERDTGAFLCEGEGGGYFTGWVVMFACGPAAAAALMRVMCGEVNVCSFDGDHPPVLAALREQSCAACSAS